ncbi:MAG: NAD(P)/FAD-dependent oxidoreductase, partial [Spirochaetes bacterium]|nr:NAD(P)/FAD-dependent oxidoreductase [Spirochaetota bacterium]
MHVAIIGGGFSGLLAGYLLKKKGIQVTVYEKEEFLGGHCRSLIVNKETIELGTVFSFNDSIRSLLLELNVDFREQFTYRNFIDDHFSRVEQLSRHEVAQLIEELSRLEKILARFTPDLNVARYGYIHQDLLVPVY